MRRLVAVIFVLVFSLMVSLAIAEDKPLSLEVELGYTGIGKNDNSVKVGEYDSLKSRLNGEVEGTVNFRALNGTFGVYYYTPEEKNYNVDFNVGRIFRIRGSYDSFIHRLQHDYMMTKDPHETYNFNSTTRSGSPTGNSGLNSVVASNPVTVVDLSSKPNVSIKGNQALTYEDLSSTSPGKNMIRRSKTNFDFELNIPFFSYLKPYFNFEQQEKHGWHQTYVQLGKCAPCHTVAVTTRINERTRDYTVGAKFNWNIVSINYSHTYRSFDNRRGLEDVPPLYYDYYIFGIGYNLSDRLIYGKNSTARVYYDEIPDIQRHTDKVVMRFDLPYVTTGILQGYWDKTKNNYINKEYTSSSYAIKLVNNSIKGLTLALTGRYYTIDNDDVKVRMGELAQVPYINSYTDLTGKPLPASAFDYTRKSILDRDVYEAKLDLSYKLAKNYTLIGSYQYKRIERDHKIWKDYDTHPCYTGIVNGQRTTVCLEDERFLKDDTTQIHQVKLGLSGRPMLGKVNFRLTYMYQYVDDAFTSKSVGLEDGRYGDGYPYQFFYNLERRGYGSNIAKDTHEVKLYTSWNALNNLIANLDLTYRYEKNDDVSNDYKLDRYYAGVSLFYMPIERLSISLGSLFDYSRIKQKLFVDVYRACAGATFGSQAVGALKDEIDYNMYNWLSYLSIDYSLRENFKIFADLSYTYSKAYGNSPKYPDMGQYPLTSDALLWPSVYYTGGPVDNKNIFYLMTFDPNHLSGLNSWTKLRYDMLEANLGFDWTFYKNLGLKVMGIYRYVNDKANYLGENHDGKVYGVSAYLTYSF